MAFAIYGLCVGVQPLASPTSEQASLTGTACGSGGIWQNNSRANSSGYHLDRRELDRVSQQCKPVDSTYSLRVLNTHLTNVTMNRVVHADLHQ